MSLSATFIPQAMGEGNMRPFCLVLLGIAVHLTSPFPSIALCQSNQPAPNDQASAQLHREIDCLRERVDSLEAQLRLMREALGRGIEQDQPVQIGLDGFCPVTLVVHDIWKSGNPEYASTYRGVRYYFVSEHERQIFDASPDSFAPVNRGRDVITSITENRDVLGKRAHGIVFGKRIYLFVSEQNLGKFKRSPQMFSELAEIVEKYREREVAPRHTTDTHATRDVKDEALYLEMIGPSPELPLPMASICQYQVTITNRSDKALDNVRLLADITDGWQHESGGNPIELQLEPLNPGQSRQVELALKLTGTGRQLLKLTVTASETHTAKLSASVTADDGVHSDGEAKKESN
jgi:YHS domain-containing protein